MNVSNQMNVFYDDGVSYNNVNFQQFTCICTYLCCPVMENLLGNKLLLLQNICVHFCVKVRDMYINSFLVLNKY